MAIQETGLLDPDCGAEPSFDSTGTEDFGKSATNGCKGFGLIITTQYHAQRVGTLEDGVS